jgi:hypothetical protein
MAVSVDLASALDQAYEDRSLKEILAALPSALAALTEPHIRCSPTSSEFRQSPN